MAKEKPEKAPGAEKIKKAPGFYKKSLTEEQLNKYLKYIEIGADKDFIQSCYIKEGDAYRVRTDLKASEVKRLKLLARAIKKNRKMAVNVLPLGIAAIVIAGLVVFFAVFANPLLEKALETGLEAIFEAKVEADNFRLSVFKFEIGLSGLAIADRDSPMKNLIQFDRMAVRLRPNAVLRGKVYVEEIRADRIRFGADRTVSGALPDKPAKVKPKRPKAEIPPLVDLKNFDAIALLNREFDKLQTPKLYGAAKDVFEASKAKWEARADAVRNRAGQLRDEARPLLALNINDFKTLDVETVSRIRTTVEQINSLVDTVQDTAGDVNGIVVSVQDDFNTAVSLVQDAKNSFTGDINHLKSYVDLSSGAAMEAVEPVIKDIMTDTALTYLSYGERALEILEKVKAIQTQLPRSSRAEKPKAQKFQGRDVVFPTRSYPRFYLGTLASDVFTPNDWHWGFELTGVSSDPDLSGVPTTLALSLEEAGDGLNRTASFNGMADFRSNAGERFDAQVSGGGFPVDISAELSKIGIGGFAGNASFRMGLSGRSDKSFAGSGAVSLAQARIIKAGNTITEAISEALGEVPSLDLGLDYKHNSSAEDEFSVSTNIGDIVMASLKKIANQYMEKALAELERALNEKLASYIDGAQVSRADLDNFIKIVRGDKEAVDGLKNALNSKKDEFEKRLKAAAEDAAKQVVDDAKAQTEQAIKDVLQGKTPGFEAPKVPSLPFKR
ncbi:MAG: hypothetical protein LBF78_01645 [Treponema sp.]|jgi:uncharacterized protein (TIGR03545 family)|nr:hypothetical protein [Treponema sp.]